MSKLLFIQYRPFGEVMNGGDQGTKKNLDALRAVLGEANVDVFYLHDKAGKSSPFEYLKGMFYLPFGYFLGLTPKKVEQIVRKAEAYDFVFIDRSLFGVIAKALKAAHYKGKILTSFQNVEVLYMDAKVPKHLPLRSVLIHCADQNDKWSCCCSDIVIALNERDKAKLKERYQREADVLIPVTLSDRLEMQPDKTAKTAQRVKCLSIGAYFGPNNEGILWFVQQVLPHVDVEYKIVGKGMAKLKDENSELLHDIEVISDAPSLTPYFEEADVMVLPIFAGSGMKVKTCESLMYGKNIIATDEALEGYAIEEGVSAWRCNAPEEFIACIKDFAANPRSRFNKAARQCFLDNYSNTAVEKKFKELLS
ncbi:MAG: glycosyltransferase [Paludibacteraceae bacterium]|nr:glycosyltransferase [Paludibacteraceae bacterium]